MSTFLMASVPIFGHVSPMARLAAELTDHGHQIRFLTGRRFEPLVTESGADFLPLPDDADFDDRTVNDGIDVTVRPKGLAGLRYDVATTFLRPAAAQHRALLEALAQTGSTPRALDQTMDARIDAVVVDPTFVGAALLAAAPRSDRPPVVVAGVLPLPLDSVDTPPFGLGLAPRHTPAGAVERLRNRLLRIAVQRVAFRPVQRDYDRLFRAVTGHPAPGFVMSWMSEADAVVQLSVPGFEYPRSDATVPLTFAGPVIRPSGGPVPSWWADLDSGRPVVLATQGTIANDDLDEVLQPTIQALADTDVLLVVTTGGRPVSGLGVLPQNVRAAEFLPYDRLFPHLSAFVTNGGYGGVHFALAHGVPVVVAGAGEDKPEVAARVAWSGTGINLRTGRPSPAAVGAAVRRVLDDESYAAAAGSLGQQIAETDATATLLAAAGLSQAGLRPQEQRAVR